MATNGLSVKKNTDGTFTIENANFRKTIYIRGKSGQEQFEAVRAVILAQGLYFSQKVEKIIEKELGL